MYCTITTSEDRYVVQQHSTPARGWNPARECEKLSRVIRKSNVQPEGLQLNEDQRIQSIITTMESIREPLIEANAQNRQIAQIKDLGEQIKSINKLISKAHEAKEKIVEKEKKHETKASLKMQAQQNKLQTRSEKKEKKAEERRIKEQGKEAEAKEKVVEKERKRHPVELGSRNRQAVSKKEAFPFEFDLTSDERMDHQLPSLLDNDDGGIGKIFSLLRHQDGTLTQRGKCLVTLIARYTAKPPKKIEEILRNMGNAWDELAPQIIGPSKVCLIRGEEVEIKRNEGKKFEEARFLYVRSDCLIARDASEILRDVGPVLRALPAIMFFLQNVNVSEFMQANPKGLASALFDADYASKGKSENLEKLFKAGFTPLIEWMNGTWESVDVVIRAERNYEANKKLKKALKLEKKGVQIAGFAPFKKTALKKTIYVALDLGAKIGLLQSLFAQTKFEGEAVEKFEKNLLILEKLIVKALLKKHDITHYLPLIIKSFDANIKVLSKWIEIAESQDKSEETLKTEFVQTLLKVEKEFTVELITVIQTLLKEISTNPEEPEIFNLLLNVFNEFRWHPKSPDFTSQLYVGIILPFLDRLLSPEKPREIAESSTRRETVLARTGWTMGASRSSAKEKESENIDRT